jgi:hypothetical protein
MGGVRKGAAGQQTSCLSNLRIPHPCEFLCPTADLPFFSLNFHFLGSGKIRICALLCPNHFLVRAKITQKSEFAGSCVRTTFWFGQKSRKNQNLWFLYRHMKKHRFI